MTKQELRLLMRRYGHEHAAHRDVSPDFSPLWNDGRFASASIVLLYSALPDEVPTQPLLDQLVLQGKTVLLPRVAGPTEIELHHYTGPHDLQPGAFGIMEPTGTPVADPSTVDVAVIPGMAFDAAGHRLGRGKGYYDRLLSRMPHTYRIGLCHAWQLVPHVPTDDHDVCMHRICTV